MEIIYTWNRNENQPFPLDSINANLNLEDVYNKIDWSLLKNKKHKIKISDCLKLTYFFIHFAKTV